MMESSKRSKAPGSTSQNVQCLVDGCNADLTQCRDYHRRHKVCEFHSKSPTVRIAGLEQRFCQQCSRFHSPVEFDDVKRSCRKRLDGHNRRRRKPQPELRNAGLLLNSQQGSRVLSFSTPQICSTVGVSSTWASMVKPENDFVMYNNPQSNWSNSSNTCPASSFSAHGGSYKGGGLNHLQFLKQNNEPPGGSRYVGGQTNDQVLHSDSALSLLSSQSAPGVTMEVGFNPMVLHHHHHHESLSSQSQTAAQVVHSTQFNGGALGGNRDSHVSSNATFQFQEMFQNGPDESSGSGSHQTLTFLWE